MLTLKSCVRVCIVCLSVHVSVCPSVHLFNFLFISLSVYSLSGYLSVCLFIHLSSSLSVCPFVRLFVCLSVCLFVCLCVSFQVTMRNVVVRWLTAVYLAPSSVESAPRHHFTNNVALAMIFSASFPLLGMIDIFRDVLVLVDWTKALVEGEHCKAATYASIAQQHLLLRNNLEHGKRLFKMSLIILAQGNMLIFFVSFMNFRSHITAVTFMKSSNQESLVTTISLM